MMLHAKYECSSLYGLSQVDFKKNPSLFLCKIGCAWAKPKYDRRRIILISFGRGSSDNATHHLQMISPLWFVRRKFFKDFLLCFYVK